MNGLLGIATASMQKVLSTRKWAEETAEQRAVKKRIWAEEAYKSFEALSTMDGIRTLEIADSHGAHEPCVVITDTAGRKLEIHHAPSTLADRDYHLCVQWQDNKWYDTTVFMSKFKAAGIIGKWLAETQATTDSLKCK